MSKRRLAFLDLMLRQTGKPYIWASKGPESFDCSGLVTWCLRRAGGPDWRIFHNCQKLWDTLPPTDKPAPGDLSFYGRKAHPSHVMVVFGDGRVFGAAGGNSSTQAATPGAFVKFKSQVKYRPDWIGFRRLAPLDEETPNGTS